MSSEGNYFSFRSEEWRNCKSQQVRCSVFLMPVQEASARVYPAQTPIIHQWWICFPYNCRLSSNRDRRYWSLVSSDSSSSMQVKVSGHKWNQGLPSRPSDLEKKRRVYNFKAIYLSSEWWSNLYWQVLYVCVCVCYFIYLKQYCTKCPWNDTVFIL